MHQKRTTVSKKIPIPRKGTKYVVRSNSHLDNSVPVIVAVRDMLNLAKTLKEVKHMIHTGLLKINGRTVKDHKESIKIFNVLEADKAYVLELLPTGRFTLEETKDSKKRLCKVTNKKLITSNNIQFNLHDGSNVISKEKVSVGDSVYLDNSSKIVSVSKLEKGAKAFVISGKYIGLNGSVVSVSGKKVEIKLDNKEESTELSEKQLIVR